MNIKQYTIGIDVGSVAAKAVLYDGQSWEGLNIPTGWSPKQAGQELYQRVLQLTGISEEQIGMIVATGYGRVNLDFADRTFSEIACHAKGAKAVFPATTGVIDIGGQDSKIIALDLSGKVGDFILNDKCAAGTGRFLQATAQALGLEVAEIDRACQTAEPVQIASMCAVFAESEVIGLLAQGVSKEQIMAGILQSIARRMGSMAGRLCISGHVTFCGGVAQSRVLGKLLAQTTGWEIEIPEQPQFIGALGAAVTAYEILRGDRK